MAITAVRSSDRILHQALELFSSKGYDGTSVREICAAAEITKPTLYHFYGSKEGVYRALVQGSLEDFQRTMLGELERPGTPVEQLKAVARAYFENTRENRQLMRFLFALVHNPPSAAPRIDFTQYYENVVAHVAAVVEEGVRQGAFAKGDLEVRMLVFMGALGEALCGWLLTAKPDLTASLADRIVDTVTAGWGPASERR
jgi:AcrR family transcriptional regulator